MKQKKSTLLESIFSERIEIDSVWFSSSSMFGLEEQTPEKTYYRSDYIQSLPAQLESFCYRLVLKFSLILIVKIRLCECTYLFFVAER